TAMEKGRYSRTESRIVYYSALLSNKEYAAAFPILEKLIVDYPDNFVLYTWATEWYREQRENLKGAEYFERMYQRQASRSPRIAAYALVEKVILQFAQNRKSEALATLQRIKGIPVSDQLLSTKVQGLEK